MGATTHWVTAEPDAGPIIEQDIVRVDYRSSARTSDDSTGTWKGAVLARAVSWHLEDHVFVHGNKTIVFG